MESWSTDLTVAIATAIRTRRKELGMTAQDVANRTAELGHPVSRSGIAGWENRKAGINIRLSDALVVLHALDLDLGPILAGKTLPNGEPLRAGNEATRLRRDGARKALDAITGDMWATITNHLGEQQS